MSTDSRILKLDQISHAKLKSLDPAHTAVIASISPIEVHGPHLPLGQDWYTANALMERVAEIAAGKWTDWTFVMTPPIPAGCDTIPHLGSVNYPAPLIRDIAYYTLRPFARAGFARLAFSSFHGGPRHFCALEDAADRLSRRHPGVAAMSFFSVVASRMSENHIFHDAVKDRKGTKVTREQLDADLHAGYVETSVGLHLWPEFVEDGWKKLPEHGTSASEDPHKELLFGDTGPRDIATHFRRAAAGVKAVADTISHYKQHTYAGYPNLSSAAQGKLLFDHLSDVASGIVDEFMEKGTDMNVHSPVWPLRELLLSPPINTVLEEWLHMYSG